MPRTIAEQITETQTRSTSIDDELTTIMDAASDENRDLSPDEVDRMAVLNGEKTIVVKRLETLQDTEATLAARARPAHGAPVQRLAVPAVAHRAEKPGAMIGKLALVAAFSHVTKQPPDRIIATRYAADDRVAACHDFITRSASGIADTTTPGWAAELVRQDVAAFMDDLVAISVFAALRGRPSTVSLNGMGNISVPGRNRGGLGGAWVGEAGAIPVLGGSLFAAKLEPTKLGGITTFSRELMNATNDEIETILRNGLREDTANVLDVALLDAAAKVPGVRPAGLQNGAPSAPSLGPGDVLADLRAAIDPIIAAGGGRDIILIMNPSQKLALEFSQNALGLLEFPTVSANGTLLGRPIIDSINVPLGVVIVLDAADFANQTGMPEFMVSEEATLTMASADATAPTQAVSGTGTIGTPFEVLPDGGIRVDGGPTGPGTAGAQVMSMFQQWSVAVRLVVPVHWTMRRTGMVSVITAVDWGNAVIAL
jgi:HK97 family phage major capsid protein